MVRIQYLDGFRGLAIILVILYHTFTRWTSLVPYGNKYANFIIFNTGWLGVQLFFMISGYVILMTLEKCNSFKEFILKRWLRLFPAMLIASIFSYCSSFYFIDRPYISQSLIDFLPGLLFIEPDWINSILNINSKVLEGGFWSLFLEVRFYIIFGIIYFKFGQKKAITTITFLFFLSFFFKTINTLIANDLIKIINIYLNKLGFIYFSWFSIGSLTFLYHKERKEENLYFAIVIGLFSVLYTFTSHENSIMVLLASIGIITIFYLPILFKNGRKIFENKYLIFIGFISYPLYLIHENLIISCMIKLNKTLPQIPYILLPILPITLTIFISYIIAKFLEPRIYLWLSSKKR